MSKQNCNNTPMDQLETRLNTADISAVQNTKVANLAGGIEPVEQLSHIDQLSEEQRKILNEGGNLRDMLEASGVHPSRQNQTFLQSIDWEEAGTTALKYTLGAAAVVAIAYGGYKLLTSGSEAAPE